MDYGFTHDGHVFTPNKTMGINPADSDARNRALESAELMAWAARPTVFVAYYDTRNGVVTTWTGERLGAILGTPRVYRHNFGSRMISLRVKGSNGATYSGRASYDHGNIIRLRKTRG